VKKGEHKEIFSIRKYKAYGANSALIGLVGPAVLMGSLLSPVQAEENTPTSDSKPLDRVETSGASTSDVETDHLIVTSSQPGLHPTEEADSRGERGTSEGLTTPKRAVSIVYKVRYVDRQRKTVVHEVTKTKTVETSEAKARATVTEIGAELANDSQLENYYVPDGNPTTMTKEIVEGEDNVFVYEVEGFGEAEATNRTVTLKYTVDYVDEKSGLVLASEDKEETVSTFEAVAKKEVTVQASLDGNEALKGWSLPANAADHQTLTLVEGSVGKVTFKVQNSDKGKVRKKRKVEYPTPAVTGQPYLTLENRTDGYPSRESMTFAGNGQHTYEIRYKIGFTNIEASDLEMTQGAKDLGFTLDLEGGWLTATLTPTRALGGNYEVGFQSKTNPQVKAAGTIKITTNPHFGFMVLAGSSREKTLEVFRDNTAGSTIGTSYFTSKYTLEYSGASIIGPIINNDDGYYIETPYIEDSGNPKTDITINGIKMPTTPFGYFMDATNQTVESATADTKRYYAMLPIFAPKDLSTDYANNNKQGLSITDFHVLSASAGVEVKLVDLRKDKAPDKGFYSNAVNFQTMPEYDLSSGNLKSAYTYILDNTPYYLQFTKLPPTAGNYSVKFQMTDSLGLVKTITLNFTTYENSISNSRSSSSSDTNTYALTNADALFEPNEEYIDKVTDKVTLPISDKEQILGKVTLNKDNAYIKADSFPAGVELRAVPGKVDTEGHPTEAYVVKTAGTKVAMGKYSFSVKAHDGHYQTGAPRTFEFEIVDAINPIPNQHWREGTVPSPIPVSMENNSKITGIRVESSGGYALFEGNTSDSNATISIYGLKSTPSQQKARVYVTFIDGNGEKHETFTDFYYDIDPNPVADLAIDVTNREQEITEGEEWKEMVITTTPSEGVTIKVDKAKLPKGTRLEGNKITGKGLYEGTYDVPVLAIKGDVVKSTLVHLVVRAGTFTVPPETVTVPVLSKVSGFGLQNAPDDANITYRANDSYVFSYSGLTISNDGTKITGTPTRIGSYEFTATISRRGSNGLIRTTTTTYTINVTGLRPTLTISSPAQPTQPTAAYGSEENRLIASIGSPIPTITIKHDSHSRLSFNPNSLPKGLNYSYDEATHTGTITGTPREVYSAGNYIPVSVEMPSEYSGSNVRNIYKYIYIEVTPVTSPLTIDHENQTFAANEEMTPITVSDFDERATVDLEYAPDGVSYDPSTHQITGAPTAGVGRYSFNVRALMPDTLGGQVTSKRVTLKVTKLEATLTATPPSVTVTATNPIPEITITKDSLSTLAKPTVTIEGQYYPKTLSELGLSYDAASGKITGTPTVVGHHTIHLSTTLSKKYTGVEGYVKNLDIPLDVTPLHPSLESNLSSVNVTVKNPIPEITITKDSLSTLYGPTVKSKGRDYSLSEFGLSYDAKSGKITGSPTIVGNHTIYLATLLAEAYTGVSGGVIKRLEIPLTVTAKEFDFIEDQERTTTVLSPIEPVDLTVAEGIDVEVGSRLPSGVTYNAVHKRIEGTPTDVGDYSVTVTARPSGVSGNDKRATIRFHVTKLPATIEITPREQNVQVGTPIAEVTVKPNEHASVYGTDALLNAVSGYDYGIVESNIANYFLGAYGLTYNPTNRTITGTPTKTGRIVFTFIARNDDSLGGAEARETLVLNVVETLSKIPVITEAQEGANVIKGSGVAGATVTVTLPDGVEKTAEVAVDGTWTVATTAPLVKGQSISARQKEENKTLSNDISATVIAKEGLVPSKEAGVDAIIEGATTITGKGINGSTINLTLPDGTVKTATVSEGTWSVTIDTAVVKGENIRVTQTEPNKATSPIVTATVVPKITKGDKGETGANGTNGKDGFTPEVSVEETPDGSYTITVTQPEGKKPITVTVKNGTNGRDGRTPKVALTPIYENPAQPRTRRARSVDETQPTRKQIGVHITVYYDNNNNGTYDEGIDEKITEEDIYDGVDGNDGRDGRDGKDILNGTENPSETQGKDGDTFVNTATGDVFVKENGTWKPAGNIRGPKGADGKDILNGKTNPTPDTGKDGDTFVNTATGDVFVKENGAWKPAGNIKGLQGDAGATGANGVDGHDGAAGRDGKDILNGTATPDETQGKDGDTFVNTATGDVFVKENGTWKPAGNIRGPKGADGKDILNGKTDPTPDTGKDGDTFVNTATGDVFVKENGIWKPAGNIKGLQGDAGATGANGADGHDGAAGRDGRDGKDILNGTATPDETQGKDGDTFVNTATGDVFVKENGTWKPAGNIRGPKGADGKDILNGKTDPTPDTGKDGDTFVNTATGDVFVKENGTWKSAGNIKGPKGDKGENGTNGTDGAAGATGATGAAGRDGKDGFTPKVTVTDNPDGSHTITITQPDNQPPLTTTVRNGVNGLNGKSLVAKKEGNETKIYVEDPANPGQPLDPTKPLATILDGLKGDSGADGKSPTVRVTDNGDGTHTITIHNPDNSESSTIVKNGENGKTATITTIENPDGSHTITVTNPDGSTKETVIKNGKDGKTPKVEVTDNNDGTHTVKVTDGDGNVRNTIIKDGKDGKAATATIAETNDGNHTVTITNPDGTETKFVVKNGRDGVDGRTPTASVRDNGDGSHTIVITNPEGVTTETTVYDGKSPTVSVTDEHNGTHKITVVNGDGTTTETIIKDGKSPVATVKDNKDGTYTIRVENGNGTVSETTVRDGKSPTAKVVDNGDGTHTVTIVNSDGTTSTTTVRDGKSPKLEVINNNNGSYTVKVTGTDGKETSTTIFDGKSPTAKIVDNGDGTHTVTIIDSDGHSYTSTIKDGKDGQSPTASVRNNNDGTHTVTIINPDGSKTETVIKDGKDGKSPTVNVKDNGDGTHTITIVNTDGGVITTVIRDGKCGCNNQPGGSTGPKPDSPKPEGSTGPKPDSPKPEGSTGPKPDSPKPEGSTGPKPDSPKPEGSTGPKPDSPKPEGSRFEIPEPPVHEIPEYIGVVPVEPTPVGSTPSAPTPAEPVEPTPNEPTPEMPIPSANTNPIVPTLVFENHENRLPETGTQSDYLFLLLGSGILLSLYVGRRKED